MKVFSQFLNLGLPMFPSQIAPILLSKNREACREEKSREKGRQIRDKTQESRLRDNNDKRGKEEEEGD